MNGEKMYMIICTSCGMSYDIPKDGHITSCYLGCGAGDFMLRAEKLEGTEKGSDQEC